MLCYTGNTNAWKEHVKRAYESDEMADVLDNSLHPGGLKLTAHAVDLILPAEGAMILELACGRGGTTHFLTANYNCPVYGIDLSIKSLVSASLRNSLSPGGEQAFFAAADIEKLPFVDSTFDIVLCECSFSLLPDKGAAAKEIFRVLKPGGKFVMSDMVIQGDPAAIPELLQTMPPASMFNSCLADALTIDGYMEVLTQNGMKKMLIEDHSIELKRLTFKLYTDPRTNRLFKGDGNSDGNKFISSIKKLKPGYYLMIFTRENN